MQRWDLGGRSDLLPEKHGGDLIHHHLMCQEIFVFLIVNDENVLVLLWCHLHLGRRRARTTLRWHASPQHGSSVAKQEDVFGPVIGGQVYRIPPISTEKWEESAPCRENRKILAKRRIELEGYVYEGMRRERILDVFRRG